MFFTPNRHLLAALQKLLLSHASYVVFSPEPPPQSPVSRNGFDPQSDVYKMLQDYEEPVSAPKQSGSFKYLQEILDAEDGGTAHVFVSDIKATNGIGPNLCRNISILQIFRKSSDC